MCVAPRAASLLLTTSWLSSPVTGEKTGEDALNFLLALRGGEFNLKPFVEPAKATIEGQWEFLLMEAARRRDEAAIPPTAPDEGATAFISAPSVPALEPEPPPARANTPDFAPPPTPARAARPRAPSPPAARRIDEVLVCSAQNDVLYEWQSPGLETRLKFFQLISEKAEQFAQHPVHAEKISDNNYFTVRLQLKVVEIGRAHV